MLSTERQPNIVFEYLQVKDYEELKQLMIACYPQLEEPAWKRPQIERLVEIFPEGQVVLRVDDRIAGVALSIIVNGQRFNGHHTYRQATGDYTFKTHTTSGDTLYGIDVFIHPDFRAMRLGRRLYDYRKEFCEKLNLKGITFGGRIPNYHQHSATLSPRQYIEQVRMKAIHDPVLNFQLQNDFYPSRVLKGYLAGDLASEEYAVLMRWDNIYYEPPQQRPRAIKTEVRLGLVQWQMRSYHDLDDLMSQAEFFVDALSTYRSDFALFPEFFNAPLMAAYNELSEPEAIRQLATYTEPIRKRFSELAMSYNINIITGSMPEIRPEDGKLYNVGFLCHRDGRIEKYVKIHVTPDEKKVWGMVGGHELRTFDTDAGKIGILICYDVEFPELSRLLAMEEMEILFVPFLTDTQNGYSRVRHCAQARAIENECYVVIAGSVGNLPRVHNMDIQYAQSAVFSPCDFSFPSNGIKAEATTNTEMILVADANLDLLTELNAHGSVKNMRDRREDVYSLRYLHKKPKD